MAFIVSDLQLYNSVIFYLLEIAGKTLKYQNSLNALKKECVYTRLSRVIWDKTWISHHYWQPLVTGQTYSSTLFSTILSYGEWITWNSDQRDSQKKTSTFWGDLLVIVARRRWQRTSDYSAPFKRPFYLVTLYAYISSPQ